jgi:hypothetical protein
LSGSSSGGTSPLRGYRIHTSQEAQHFQRFS